MRDEFQFLPSDKDESLLQVDSIILSVHSKAYPNYPKITNYNNLAISQGKCEGLS